MESETPSPRGYATSRTEPDGYDPLTGAYLQYDPVIPFPLGATVKWMQSEKFNEISRWRFRVDRMGILMEPRTPVAWKGTHPSEVYFWTGTEWARVKRKIKDNVFSDEKKEAYDDILLSARDSITEVLYDRSFVWYEPDTPSLAANASLMRYKWVGTVDLLDAELRAEKLAKKKAEAATPAPEPEHIWRMSREK
jgi:hypothetical protein